MKVYTYSEARQNLSKVLTEAKSEDVLIRRRGGDVFRITPESPKGSPFEVEGINTDATTQDIVRAVRESRKR